MSTLPNFNPPVASPAAPGVDPAASAGISPQMKMMMAQALMGGAGGGGGGAQNSFAGGLSQGVNPMLQAMIRQRMMQQMMGGGAPAAPAGAPSPGIPMGGAPDGNIG
jgi:hypothetical protein